MTSLFQIIKRGEFMAKRKREEKRGELAEKQEETNEESF
jgi:hypothetical protein